MRPNELLYSVQPKDLQSIFTRLPSIKMVVSWLAQKGREAVITVSTLAKYGRPRPSGTAEGSGGSSLVWVSLNYRAIWPMVRIGAASPSISKGNPKCPD
jgi:hypothetical protein